MNYELTRQFLIAHYNALLPEDRPPKVYPLDLDERFVSGLGLLSCIYEHLVKTEQADHKIFIGLNGLLEELYQQGDKQVRDAMDLGFIEHLGLEDPLDMVFCQKLLSSLPECLKTLHEREMARWDVA